VGYPNQPYFAGMKKKIVLSLFVLGGFGLWIFIRFVILGQPINAAALLVSSIPASVLILAILARKEK
jgi:hypothetical protein